MRLPLLLLVCTASAASGAREAVAGDGGPPTADQEASWSGGGSPTGDQEASETGHRRARLWRKALRGLYSHAHKLAYPAAHLLGKYAKHLGHSHHHHDKGRPDQGYGLGHHWDHSPPLQHWGHGVPQGAIFDSGLYDDHHLDGPLLEYQPAHSPLYGEEQHSGLYPEGGWWGSAWDGYGWGDHSMPYDEFWN